MLGAFAKFFLVATSLAPITLTWAFADWRQAGPLTRQWAALGVTLGLVLLCWLIIEASKRQLQVISFSATSVRPADAEVVGFVVAYLLPLVSTSTGAFDYTVLAFVGVLLALVVWSVNAFTFNPLLTLLGYHFYEVASDNGVSFVLVTRRNIRRATDLKSVVQLTNYLLLDKPTQG